MALAILLLAGCPGPDPAGDGGPDISEVALPDAGPAPDSGPADVFRDAGVRMDAGPDSGCRACGAGTTCCGTTSGAAGACVNLASDPMNCGACGNACNAGYTCRNGECHLRCGELLTECRAHGMPADAGPGGGGEICTDTNIDPMNCGACGMECSFGHGCVSRRCSTCGAGLTECSGTCTDLQRDTNNCGACGHACDTGCYMGMCGAPVEVRVGQHFSCVRFNSNRVACWGSTSSGRLASTGSGFEHRGRPVLAVDTMAPIEVTQFSLGLTYVCGVRLDHTVVCWGSNLSGELGRGMPSMTGEPPALVRDVADALQVSAGDSFACATLAGGGVRCWGRNDAGQLGDRTTTNRSAPVAVDGLVDAVEVSTGSNHACARRRDGTVACWGANASGQLGDGTTTSRNYPVTVSGVTGAVQVDAGGDSTCVRLAGGAVWCWGRNDVGQLGDGTTMNRPIPRMVTGWRDATQMSVGTGQTCALFADGMIRCAGSNVSGQLGDGTTMNRTTPVTVTGLVPQAQVDSRESHTCALSATTPPVVHCWGWDRMGNLGIGHEVQNAPRVVTGLSNVTGLAMGRNHACTLLADHAVRCWGDVNGNQYGQLGAGVHVSVVLPSVQPTVVAGLSDVTQLTAGQAHTCARKTDGTVWCWGRNDVGQLGDGTRANRSAPTRVAGLTNAQQVEAGINHTCARLVDGSVWCWGYNFFGQLGNGVNVDSTSPVHVSRLTDAVEISLGANHSCARTRDGRVMCWGYNQDGELGEGSTRDQYTPEEVTSFDSPARAGLTGVTRIFCRQGNTCTALREDGSVVIWGDGAGLRATSLGTIADYGESAFGPSVGLGLHCMRVGIDLYCAQANEWGQLGRGYTGGTTASSAAYRDPYSLGAPARVTGTDYVDVDTSGTLQPRNVCALKTDGTVWCWGWVGDGLLNVTGLNHVLAAPPSAPVAFF